MSYEMMNFKSGCIATILTCCITPQLIGQTLDDFSAPILDESKWIKLDTSVILDGTTGEPVGVKPFGPGIFDTSTGTLNLRTTGEVPATPGVFDPVNGGFMAVGWLASAVDPSFSNGTVRSKIRVDSDVVASVNLRSDLTTFSSYNFAISPDGAASISRFDNGVGSILVADPEIGFGQGEDWWIEAGSIGSTHSLKLWRVGEAEPLSPQLTVADTTYTQGILGLGTGLGAGNDAVVVNATFDDVAFVVPEPSSITMLLFATLMLTRMRRLRFFLA